MEFKFSSFFFISLFIFAGFVISTKASIIKKQECKVYQPMQGFDKSKFFSGSWYTTHIQKIYLTSKDVCQKFKFQISSDGSIQQITKFYLEEIKGLINAEGPITSDSNFGDGLGVFNWTFHFVRDGKRVDDNTFTFPITVLDTDYDNYAILYSCRVIFNFLLIDELSILRRDKEAELNPKIKEVLSKAGVDFDKLSSRKSVECPEDPNF
uniref:Venom triabin 1 n=1 Tax=Ectomocoris sp. TaxID=3104572 RepID=A0AB38ZE95_9HEMI